MSGIGSGLKSLTGSLFGDASQGAAGYGGPTNWHTPFSSVVNGNVTIDPTVRAMQDRYLQQIGGIGNAYDTASGNYLGTLNDLRGRYLGNEGAFVRAAVDPVKASVNTALGTAAKNMGLRGLSGSSFYNDTLAGIGLEGGRAVGDAAANATAQNLGFESNLAGAALDAAGQRANIDQGVAGATNQVASERLQQELASLGLSQAQIGQLMGSFYQQQGDYNQMEGNRQRFIGGLFNTMAGGKGLKGMV